MNFREDSTKRVIQKSRGLFKYQITLRSMDINYCLRDWSLITGRGGLQNGRGGAREVLPLRKGGAEKVLAMLKGGHKKFWGRFYVVA